MKRRTLAVAAVLVLACLGATGGNATGKRQLRVGFLIYSGVVPSKRSLDGQMLAGFLKAEKKLDIQGRVVYVGPTQDPTGPLTFLARQHYDLIVIALARLDVVYSVARKFPHVRFFSLDTALHGPPNKPKNAQGSLYRAEEGGYLAASSSARSLGAAPVFGSPKAVVPFTADDVGAATEMESGDLNGDGLLDLVVTRITYPPAHITHPIGIFLADGHGGFTDGSSMWDGPPTHSEWGRQIIIADFNGDHRNDIFVADHGYDAPPYPGHPNELALSTPQGKLIDASANLPPESGFSHSATAADVNGDGSVDIFVGNLCTACTPDAQPEILLNDGTGHFSRRTDLLPPDLQDADGSHRYTRSLFVDVNADGAPDLVLGADNNTTNSRVLLNDGSGHFHDAPAPLPPKPLGPTSILISLATLDINHDGRPDLLAGFTPGDPFYVGRRIQVLINNGDGMFRDETAQRLPEQDSGQGWPYAIRVADFNGDGHLDFTVDVNHYPVDHAPIYLDNGNGVYHKVPFAAAAQLFAIIDANGDRHPDIFSTVAGGGGSPEQHFVQLEIVAPATPRGLRAIGRHSGIHLTWSSVRGATTYRVWRSARSQKRRLIGTSIRPHYDDLHARRRITYTYRVQARNRAGTSPPSSAVRARRP